MFQGIETTFLFPLVRLRRPPRPRRPRGYVGGFAAPLPLLVLLRRFVFDLRRPLKL